MKTDDFDGDVLNQTHVPLITIGLPVYNAAPYLQECLQSVFAQTWTDWELLIIDDKSTDASASILQEVRDPRLRLWLADRHKGLASCLNQITARAQGKFIARMDADDVMHPERLVRQLKFLYQNPEVNGVGCSLAILDRSLTPVGYRRLPQAHAEICARPVRGFGIAHATFLGRVEWFRAHPYNESNRGCEDWELWASSFHKSRFANLSEPLYFYREFDSFSVSKYVRKKVLFAEHLWARRRQFGIAKTGVESIRQYAGMLFYAGVGLVGGTDKLLLRRNSSFPEDFREMVLEGLARVEAVTLRATARRENPQKRIP